MEGWAWAAHRAQDRPIIFGMRYLWGFFFPVALAEGEYQGLAVAVNPSYKQRRMLFFAIFSDATCSGVFTT